MWPRKFEAPKDCILCGKPLEMDFEFEDWVCEDCQLKLKFKDLKPYEQSINTEPNVGKNS